MRPRLDYQQALENKSHLEALGMETVTLSPEDPLDEEQAPIDFLTGVEAGSTIRHQVPTTISLTAKRNGLTFKWQVEVETGSAGQQQVYDQEKLRDLADAVRAQDDSDLRIKYHNLLAEFERNLNKEIDRLENRLDHLKEQRSIIKPARKSVG